MNLETNGLNTYDTDIQLEADQKKIYIVSIFVAAFFLTVSIILTIIFPSVYTLIIGYIAGGITSTALFYFLTKRIKETYYQDYKKAVKKIHLMFQVVYLLVFAGFFLIFKDYFIVIGITVGLLLNKMAIIISYGINKQKL